MNNLPAFLPSQHNLWAVAASLLLATLASYVALDLSRRVRHASGRPHLLWWALGSLAMGTGIWSMHFVGMLGFSLPISLGFSGGLTLASWVAGVMASGVALWVASEADYGLRRIAVASLAMAVGICGMHYIGMAALDMAPPIVWHAPTVLLSLLIGLGASAAALFIFKYLGNARSNHRVAFQFLASVVMGIAICGMHYTGMAAASFPADSVCLSAGQLGGTGLTAIVGLASGLLLLGTLFTSILESRLQLVARRLSRSLEEANAELTQANQELQKRAFTDALTGLPNRVLFEDRLRHALARMNRANQLQVEERIAVLFVDLDGFKPINDSFGHSAGDRILCVAAERLARTTREGDTVARIGGDEFLLLLEGVRDRAECAEAANRVLRALGEPFNVQGKQLQIACSIGIVLHPEQGEPDKLVANADAAMYEAKRAGGGNYVMFESHMGADAAKQLQLQSDLRRAVELKQFELYYQPKINGTGHGISGVEALVRWNHPQHGLIGPTEFIGLAERFGLIVHLGDWILDEACRQIAQWQAQGTRMCVAVNLSVMQLREVDFVARVERALLRHDVPATLLLCEITESVAMEDIKATQRTFEGLARVGVFLSIDDFGTGYSSLSHLRKLPARQVKIDRSFVQDLQTKEDARAVIDAVIRLAHALGLSVVAEGVENEAQRDILIAMGCDELQGFLFSRPLPAGDLLDWYSSRYAEAA
ncbi:MULTISPECIES: putative bifunctional diguanylate cyclase/phosphodiesterase [unclassified Variovorax]|uniref:putative bifunctional diguanylate cyclase/phosphodiesterase n=1 Tax=unclassified Variovorax TaxID=663243 RepID=UPI000D1167CA|nr:MULTISPECIES: bifunctional diguanylate cyclase/phosphodiesterase [unclassified Variovorax]AVQ84159.1 bifunctional diguanylate cyclase/phosphodiesterase [Variovorax sp. PMC12]QRY31483.1 EAL domain-containing protein [Variovorax sp. PDNC026]